MQSDLARESQYSHKADDSYTTFFAETDAKVSSNIHPHHRYNIFVAFNSCVAFWHFFDKRLSYADSFSYDHRTKKLSPRTSPEI